MRQKEMSRWEKTRMLESMDCMQSIASKLACSCAVAQELVWHGEKFDGQLDSVLDDASLDISLIFVQWMRNAGVAVPYDIGYAAIKLMERGNQTYGQDIEGS